MRNAFQDRDITYVLGGESMCLRICGTTELGLNGTLELFNAQRRERGRGWGWGWDKEELMMGRGLAWHSISILILSLRDKNGTGSSLVESVLSISMPTLMSNPFRSVSTFRGLVSSGLFSYKHEPLQRMTRSNT